MAAERLARVWETPGGIWGFLTAVNHRAVGKRFMVTAFIFFLLAGLEAVAIRLQIAQPLLGFLSPEAYNQTFTMHGTTMMFLFVVPFLEGLGIYFVPLMIGARDMAFPRMNAFGYWIFLIAGTALYGAYLVGLAPDSGWYNYPPLTGPGFRPGANIDFWVTAVTFLEVSALVAAVELIVTVLKQRAPGMSLDRIPVFVWAILITSFVILFAMPALILASLLLALDRFGGTHFFNVLAGGEPLLWQHLFWFFGHPDVYIMLLPAVGVISMIVPTFARRPLAGYTPIVVATLATGILSFGVWVHHMYTTGLALAGLTFFAAASMLITIPSAVQIFAWITTIWRGRMPRLPAAMLFSIGFVILFIMGGITGIMIAAVPFNWQVHDTHFIVAHFHYVLVGGVVFPIFAAIYYWFPKVTGRLLDERLGRWHFWLFFIGFNATFFTAHITGFQGMPRRVYTYLPGLEWGGLNLVSTVGAGVMSLGVLVFVWNLARNWRRGRPGGADPWDSGTLEWATASPPENFNFRQAPIVRGRDPLWEPGQLAPGPTEAVPSWWARLSDAHEGRRVQWITSLMDADPESEAILPGPTLWPLWLALALSVAFLGVIASPLLVPVGLALAGVALIGWHWPREPEPETSQEREVSRLESLPRQATGARSPIMWGMWLFIAIEATVISLLVTSYFYLRLGTDPWPPAGVTLPEPFRPGLGTGLLLVSPLLAWGGLRALKGGRRWPLLLALPVGGAMAVGYLALQVLAYLEKDYTWRAHAYGSLDWTLGAYGAMHVTALLGFAAVIWTFAARGHFHPGRYTAVQALVAYWTFVAVGAAAFFGTQYLAPYL